MDNNKLLISEDFYSCQCEGIYSMGVPAYFIRLTSCNLCCGATPKYVNQFKKSLPDQQILDKENLQKQNKATWICDSIPVWTQGNEILFPSLVEKWKQQGIYQDIANGLIHLCWTGGEPTILMHQKAIYDFNQWWGNEGKKSYQEIETNGTFFIEKNLFSRLDQINCSPKLSNSGMIERQRIVPVAIERIIEHSKYQFKFVISNERDVEEMFKAFIEPFKIPLKNVCCMPGLDTQQKFHEGTRFVLEMAKKYKFVASQRLHISAWDALTGV